MVPSNRLTLIEHTRQRNERWLHGFIAVLAGVATTSYVAQFLSQAERATAPAHAIVVLAFCLGYGWLALRGSPEAGREPVRWVATTVEVSLPLLLMYFDAQVSAEHALNDAPAALWVVAIFASVLRLNPYLSLFAGALAAAEWMGMWWYIFDEASLTDPSLQLAPAIRRSVVFAAAGVLAWYLARSLLALTQDIEKATTERERVRRAFGAYVAEPVVERVLSGDLTLTTERRSLTVLFVDIRGFTAFAESLPPAEVVDRLNEVLERFSREVQRHGGIVNKFLGDGLMALFGAPEDDPEHAVRAVTCALAIREEVVRIRASGTYADLRIGIGVHVGEVIVGDIGGELQREYTAIGDVVNVASRVESATKEYGVDLLITSPVASLVGHRFSLTQVETVLLRGRKEAVEVFSVAPPTAA